MIRSSCHPTNVANTKKRESLSAFIAEYRKISQIIVDYVWANGLEKFHPSKDQLDLPKYLDYNNLQKLIGFETNLSARALSSLATQVAGVLSASTEKRRKCLWMKEKLLKEGGPTKLLDKKLNKNWKLVKPNCQNIKPELSSKCANLKKAAGRFEYFLQLGSLGTSYGKIRIPILGNKVSKKWLERGGTILGSFLIGENTVNLRFEIKQGNPIKKDGIVVGCDQGLKTVATFSDGQKTQDEDCHGHSLYSVVAKMSRKRMGSKAFKKAQDHRKNFINASLNKINFRNFSEIRMEKIWNIGYKKRTSRLMSGWTNTLIRDKVKRLAEEAEVPLILQDSTYKSQKCSNPKCGLVRKANRKGKLYHCKNCGLEIDADLNASLNHSQNLQPIDFRLRGKGLNKGGGFFWKSEGLFNLDGSELRVPDSDKKE